MDRLGRKGYTLLELLIVVAIAGIAIAIFSGFFGVGNGLFDPGNIAKVWVIVKYNPVFWIALAFSIGIAFWSKFKNPIEFTWKELPIQIGASFAIIIGCFFFFYSTSTNIKDTEIYNCKVSKAEYYEEWTEEYEEEECSGSGDSRSCTTVTKQRYHPPEWKLILPAIEQEIRVNADLYRHYVKHFGNQQRKNLHRPRQVSFGDGDMYFTEFKGEEEKIVPASREHSYINYVKGTTVRKKMGTAKDYEKWLRPYPRVQNAAFGPIDFNRVILALDKPTPEIKKWSETVDRSLDRLLVDLGPGKEANIIVYLTDAPSQNFLHALEEHWVGGKKNDIVLIVGSREFPKPEWAAVMSWTDVEMCKIMLRDRIMEMGDLNKEGGKTFVNLVGDQISKPPNQGGFQRKRMKELQYLASQVSLPWWSQLLILIISVGTSWGVNYWIRNNEIRNYSRRR